MLYGAATALLLKGLTKICDMSSLCQVPSKYACTVVTECKRKPVIDSVCEDGQWAHYLQTKASVK